ncbi:gamma-glutamyltransferase [Almyronema epifaneia]|uniref:Glutathione hydrolase proenzyme n=1 Tax=Almyronema epifaneia S1 TaxID=2991925 RepID=A0ABW6IK00_9CYAN
MRGKQNKGCVAAGHPTTAAAGATMLEAGGNAFDAAIAAVLTACVSESVLTSLAGGGFLLAHTAEGRDTLFDFFTQTPRQKQTLQPLNFYPIEANFGDAVQQFHIGLGAIATPGVLKGLVQVHRQLGRLPLSVVAEPAMHWATAGIRVNDFQAYCYDLLQPILTANPATQAIYAPQGFPLQAGEQFYLADFATALAALVQAPEQFYQGAIAQQIVQDCQQQGGYLTAADLANYQVIERSPLKICYRGATLLTNPPPSSGGTLIAFALKLLEHVDFSNLEPGSPAHLQTLATVMRLTNEARRDGYDANLYQKNIADFFLSPSHLTSYSADLSPIGRKWGSTTHISVIDAEGNAASITTSNGEGSSYIIPGTGMMMNNMLGEEDLNPQGFHQWQENQRMSSMMAPTLLLLEGRPCLALGSGGSNRIRTAILQVISNLIDFGMPIEAAVKAPRIHWERGVLNLEPGFDRSSLEAAPHWTVDRWIWWQQQNMFFGGVHAVMAHADGRIEGAGDARRSGAIAAVP